MLTNADLGAKSYDDFYFLSNAIKSFNYMRFHTFKMAYKKQMNLFSLITFFNLHNL